jgi:hypothetical protein
MLRRIRSDWKIRLVPRDIESLTVSQTDTYPLIARCPKRKPQGKIVRTSLAPARLGVQNRLVRQLKFIVVAIHDMHPRRQGSPKGMLLGPCRVGLKRIMISRHQKHRAVTPVAPLEELDQALPPVLLRRRGIEYIPSAKNCINRVALRDSEKPIYRFNARSCQLCTVLIAKGWKTQAEMPVGRM